MSIEGVSVKSKNLSDLIRKPFSFRHLYDQDPEMLFFEC